jgi:hypothetical protein
MCRYYRVGQLVSPGRTQKLSNRDKHYVHRQVRINPRLSLRELSANFNQKFKDVCVWEDTIRKLLN